MGTLPGITSSQIELVANDPQKSDMLNYLASDIAGSSAAFVVAKSR